MKLVADGADATIIAAAQDVVLKEQELVAKLGEPSPVIAIVEAEKIADAVGDEKLELEEKAEADKTEATT